MPYTLMKGLVWILLAVLLGLVIGWLLRSVAAKRQIERARSGNAGAGNDAELERLRNRVANLEPVVNERDRLRTELDEARRSPKPATAATASTTAATPSESPATVPPGASATAGVSGATAVLGRSIEADDLTVVEGIGPTIAELCHGIGITTWAELSATEVSLLRTMLNDAGSRFATHDPTTWPEQAGLLARGAWADFMALTGRLDGARVVD